MSKKITEKRDLRASKNLIMIIIKDQAGTAAKAILEAVMNSIDAGAKKIDVEIKSNKILITDDGGGFTEDGVKTFFEEFGKEHDLNEEGISTDARFGTFRIGRGQLFAFGKNNWRSNNVQMVVDISNWGLSYEFTKGLPKKPGCTIEVELYESLSLQEVRSTIDEVTRFCRYVEHDLKINGEAISLDPAKQKWDVITDDAYIAKKVVQERWRGNGLDVYQQGVFVETIESHVYGVEGTILIRKPIKLNTARNQVIRNKPQWRKIAALLTTEGIKTATTATRMSSWQARSFVEKFADGQDVTFANFWSTACLSDSNGKLWAPSAIHDLLRGRKSSRIQLSPSGKLLVGFAPKGDMIADKVMQNQRALVLDQGIFEQLRIPAGNLAQRGEAVLNILRGISPICRSYDNNSNRTDQFYGKLEYVNYRELLKIEEEKHRVLLPKELTKLETRFLRCCQNVLQYMRLPGTGWGIPLRKLHIGVSDTADGWTDGHSYIAIDRKFVRRLSLGTERDWFRAALLLAHESCHTDSSTDTHLHTPEFYEAYHELTLRCHHAGRAGYQNYRSMLKNTEGKKLPKNVLSQLHQEAETYVMHELLYKAENV
jgi:hypothetical protein